MSNISSPMSNTGWTHTAASTARMTYTTLALMSLVEAKLVRRLTPALSPQGVAGRSPRNLEFVLHRATGCREINVI